MAPPFSEKIALSVLDDLPLGLWVGQVPSGKQVYVNRAFRSILGLDTTSGHGVTGMAEAHGVFDRQGRPYPADRLPYSQALATGRPVMVDDMVVHRPDGQRVYLRAFATPTSDVVDGHGHIVVAFSDITVEVQAQQARESVEKQLTFAVNYAPIVLWMHDCQGRISLSEGAALAGLGVAPGQLVGQSVFDLYKDDAEVLANIRRALSGEALQELYTKDDKVSFQSHLAPTFGPDGEVTGVIGVATDVTETRRLEERLFHAAEDGGGGPAGGRHRPRLQQPAGGHPGLRLAVPRSWQPEGDRPATTLEQILRAVRARRRC